MPRSKSDEVHRIDDLSSLSAENFKFRNTKFLNGEQYYGIREHETRVETRKRIWRIRNGDLRKVMRRFPRNEPVHDQCGLWVRGVAGRQFFPDANHRTAIALLRKLLKENGMPQPAWSVHAIQATRRKSKELINKLSAENNPICIDSLYERDEFYERDELFRLWWQFFERELTLPE